MRQEFLTLLARVLVQDRHVAIVGPHGTGKSTLLSNLQPYLEKKFRCIEWLRLANDPSATRCAVRDYLHRLRGLMPLRKSCLVIDGYEQLSWLQRLRLKRLATSKRCGVVITSHADQSGFVTIHRTAWNDQVAERLTAEKLSDLPTTLRTQLFASYLIKVNDLRNHQLNLRELWFMMYDDVERLRKNPRSLSTANAPNCDVCSP